MTDSLAYAILEVGGIQNFILGTGKLKEMLGGSELVESLSKSFLGQICAECDLKLLDAGSPVRPDAGQVLPLQTNAGELHLLFATMDEGRKFVRAYGTTALRDYPGLPLFAALKPCGWNRESLGSARREAKQAIGDTRNRLPVADGMPMQALCRPARLDGLPAVDLDDKDAISLPSRTRRLPRLLEAARERLRESLKDGFVVDMESLKASEDLEKLSGGLGKIAFIHMDGNDLGKMFRKELDRLGSATTEEQIAEMRKLSALVEDSTREAFGRALQRVYTRVIGSHRGAGYPVLPARPLVLGGDDVTAVVRADVALLFVETFVRAFEALTRQKGKRLSVGVGMVVCPVGYPFPKAFPLAEELLKSAKAKTAMMDDRPSSLDYVVLTNDAQNSLASQRRQTATAADGSLLTAKPFVLSSRALYALIADGIDVLERLPRSNLRPAMNDCREGRDAARKAWEQLRKNVRRKLGGRHDKVLLNEARFNQIFGDGFFEQGKDGKYFTRLGDFLELRHLLPADPGEWWEYRNEFAGEEQANA